MSDGSQAPWVLGNHDVVRPVTRFGSSAARAAALLQLALPGSAYVYQGEELGLPEVLDIPDSARQDPTFYRTAGKRVGRDGCRVPLPWSASGPSFGFSRTGSGQPAPAWLPQPTGWGTYSVEAEQDDTASFLALYKAALRLRRSHPALGGTGSLRWLDADAAGPSPIRQPEGTDERLPAGQLHFRREPGFELFANLGPDPVPAPPHREVLLSSSPLASAGGSALVPPNTTVWLAV